MRILAGLAAVGATGYLLLCLVLFLQQRRLLYLPDRVLAATPDRAGLRFEAVRIPSTDGVVLDAWSIPPASDGPWILFCHGNGGNIANRLDAARLLHDLGAGVLLFDYRGYGQSTGEPSEQGLYDDGEAVWQWLVTRQKPQQVVVFGESLGGGVATWLALRHPAPGLILESTYSCMADEAAAVYPWLPVRLLLRDRFPSIDRVPRIDCPKLFIHSPQDDVIPYRLGRRLFEAAAPPKAFYETRGGHNVDALSREPAYQAALRDFLSSMRAEKAKF